LADDKHRVEGKMMKSRFILVDPSPRLSQESGGVLSLSESNVKQGEYVFQLSPEPELLYVYPGDPENHLI
jgi:hypothetical protein